MDYVFSVWYLFRFCTAWHQGCEVFAICLLGICLDLLGYLPSALPENWKEIGYRIMGYAPCGCTSTPLQHSKPRWLSHTQKPKKNKKEQKDKHRCCLSVVSTHSSLCSRTQGESSYGPPARGQIRSHVPSHAKCRLKVSLDHHDFGAGCGYQKNDIYTPRSRVSSQQDPNKNPQEILIQIFCQLSIKSLLGIASAVVCFLCASSGISHEYSGGMFCSVLIKFALLEFDLN